MRRRHGSGTVLHNFASHAGGGILLLACPAALGSAARRRGILSSLECCRLRLLWQLAAPLGMTQGCLLHAWELVFAPAPTGCHAAVMHDIDSQAHMHGMVAKPAAGIRQRQCGHGQHTPSCSSPCLLDMPGIPTLLSGHHSRWDD